jgi:multiple sugar transport system ATP-binding protein
MPIYIEDLSMTYHDSRTHQEVSALQEINLMVEDREFLVLVGPSGCGKTTLIRLIAGQPTIDRSGVLKTSAACGFRENALFGGRVRISF